MKPKILVVDIETSPNIGYVWGLWKQNIGLNQLKETSYIMSFAAKWLGEDEIMYEENRHGDDKVLVRTILDLFDEADYVIAYNGKRFDIPTVQGRGVQHGFKPPSPFKVIDPLLTIKKEFRFPSNKLEYVAKALGVAPKQTHGKFPGFELWLQCLKQNDEAWEEMASYNKQDVVTLEEVYLAVRPYMKQHPNIGVVRELDRPVCPKCGGSHIHFRGYTHTNVSKFRKYVCLDCGGWSRERYNEYDKAKRKQLQVNVA